MGHTHHAVSAGHGSIIRVHGDFRRVAFYLWEWSMKGKAEMVKQCIDFMVNTWDIQGGKK